MPLYTLTIRETLKSSGVAALPPILQRYLWHSASSQGPERFFWVGSAQPRQGNWTASTCPYSVQSTLSWQCPQLRAPQAANIIAFVLTTTTSKRPRWGNRGTARRTSLSSQSCSHDRDRRSEALTTITHGHRICTSVQVQDLQHPNRKTWGRRPSS